MNRRPAQIVSVATIAVSAVFLLIRLQEHRHSHPSRTPLSSADAQAALPNARVSDDSPTPQPPTLSPAWTVAFDKSDYNKGTHEIWTVHPGDENPTLLLKDAGEPCWSPDRKQIGFAREGNVWVANADGSAQHQLTFWPAKQKGVRNWSIEIDGISWNQAGKFLSFGRAEQFGVTSPDGRTKPLYETTLLHVSLVDTGDRPSARFPFHQPQHVVATDWADSKGYAGDRYAPAFDITEDRTPYRFSDSERPAWSPIGKKLAFVRNGDIWLADGSFDDNQMDHVMWEVKRIAACAEYDGTTGCGDHWTVAGTGISWAPDGSFLVYSASRITGSGQEDLHILTHREKKAGDDEDPKPEYADTKLPVYGEEPSVSPDGKWILYSGSPIASMNTDPFDNKRGLWAITLDGKQCCRIASGYSRHPVW